MSASFESVDWDPNTIEPPVKLITAVKTYLKTLSIRNIRYESRVYFCNSIPIDKFTIKRSFDVNLCAGGTIDRYDAKKKECALYIMHRRLLAHTKLTDA